MDSSATLSSGQDKIVSKECDTMFPARKQHTSSRRTASFSSSSSLSSSCSSSTYFPDDSSPLNSPATPLRFSGVPFSWEKLPGIPKNQIQKKKESTLKLLPLPPPANPPAKKLDFPETVNGKNKESFRRDPFFAALVNCSRDDHDQESASDFWSGPKVSRSVSDRFGFINLYTSCKRTCAVSESIIYLPRSSRSSYDLINNRRSR